MAKKVPDVPLENEQHEQFARCLAAGNGILVCYYGVGYPDNISAAKLLAAQPDIKLRAKQRHKIMKPYQHGKTGYRHPI